MYNGSSVYAARQHQWKLFRMLGAQGVVIPGDSIAVVEALGGDPLEPPDTLPTPSLPPIEP